MADILSIAIIAFGLSADCFAVGLSIGASAKSVSGRSVLKVALAFGLFQMAMPLLGWLAGQTIVQLSSRR